MYAVRWAAYEIGTPVVLSRVPHSTNNLLSMTQGYAEFGKVQLAQLRQNIQIDVVLLECRNIFFEAQSRKPGSNITHGNRKLRKRTLSA